MALSLFLPGRHKMEVPAALLSKHTHPKLGPSVNKLVSTVKTQHKQRLEKSLSRQNQGSQTSKAQFIWFCKTSEAHLTGLFSRMPLKIMRLKSFSPFIGASLVAQLVKNLPAMQETPIRFLGQEIHWRRERLPTPLFFGLPWWLRRWRIHKQCERPGFDPGLERSPGEEKGYPLQYSGLENSIDRGAWQAIAHGVAKSRTWLSDFHFSLSPIYRWEPWTNSLSLQKILILQPSAVRNQPSVPPHYISCSVTTISEPRCSCFARCLIGVCTINFWVSQVTHWWRIACQCRRCGFYPQVGKIPWRRKGQSTPAFLPGKSHGLGSLVDYNPWGRKESDMT